jgi:hypothetical protein
MGELKMEISSGVCVYKHGFQNLVFYDNRKGRVFLYIIIFIYYIILYYIFTVNLSENIRLLM